MSRLLRQQLPFYRIGGTGTASRPSTLYRVQTAGSFGNRKGNRIAAILYEANHHPETRILLPIKSASYTETEWASFTLGLALAIQHKQSHVAIETSNLSIMHTLIFHQNFCSRQHHYFHEIMRLSKETEWAGVRWIPRALNRADDLFHADKKNRLT